MVQRGAVVGVGGRSTRPPRRGVARPPGAMQGGCCRGQRVRRALSLRARWRAALRAPRPPVGRSLQGLRRVEDRAHQAAGVVLVGERVQSLRLPPRGCGSRRASAVGSSGGEEIVARITRAGVEDGAAPAAMPPRARGKAMRRRPRIDEVGARRRACGGPASSCAAATWRRCPRRPLVPGEAVSFRPSGARAGRRRERGATTTTRRRPRRRLRRAQRAASRSRRSPRGGGTTITAPTAAHASGASAA